MNKNKGEHFIMTCITVDHSLTHSLTHLHLFVGLSPLPYQSYKIYRNHETTCTVTIHPSSSSPSVYISAALCSKLFITNSLVKEELKKSENSNSMEKDSKEEMRKGPWTEQEDVQLVLYVNLFGDRRWDFIAKVSGLRVGGRHSS